MMYQQKYNYKEGCRKSFPEDFYQISLKLEETLKSTTPTPLSSF